jgi:hypothetical protein
LLPSGGFFVSGLPTLALPGINSDSAWNYQLIDEESKEKNFVCGLPTLAFHGINSDSAGNYQLIDVESTVRMGFPPGITSSGTRIPPEEGDSTGNYQLI